MMTETEINLMPMYPGLNGTVNTRNGGMKGISGGFNLETGFCLLFVLSKPFIINLGN